MTRLRKRNKAARSEEEQDPEDHADGKGHQPHAPKPRPVLARDNRPDFAESFLYKNWKQSSLVEKSNPAAMLSMMILMMQVASSVGLGLFAGINETSAYAVPAVACAGYTLASINNAFDPDLHGLIGFLDSPVSAWHVKYFPL